VVLVILRPYDPLAERRVGRPRVHAPRPVGRGVSFVRWFEVSSSSSSSGVHLTTSARFRAGPPGSVSGRLLHDHQQEGADQHGRGFPLPFGGRRWLLGHPVPAQEFRLPHGRPTSLNAGPRRGFHVSHAQDATGVGALYSPGTVVVVQTDHDHRPAPGASQRRVPAPRHNLHHCAAPLDEPSTRVQAIRPSGLPSPVASGWIAGPSAFLRSSHPAITRSARRGGDGSSSTDPKSALRHQPNLQPRGWIYLMRATSCRTRESGTPEFAAAERPASAEIWASA
jgi:hypothetical protein